MTRTPIGVGFIGAGAVTQAIHLPTLARLRELFRVRHIFDVDAEVAQTVADRVGAAASTELEALLNDPSVEVIAVCSPDRLHADHVIAAIDAGAKAVLCEKPLATSEADALRIAEAAERSGVPLLVGAMHTFDESWRAVLEELASEPGPQMHHVRSSIVLPPNERFEDFATEVTGARLSPAVATDELDPVQSADVIRRMILGLAIHDLPLVRQLVENSRELQVHHARILNPFGYHVLATAGATRLELHASMGQPWRPDWRLEAASADTRVSISFTPSYVHAGSGISRVRAGDTTTTHGPFQANGYEAEWEAISEIFAGRRVAPPLRGLVDDLRFALAVADGVRDHVHPQLTEEHTI